MVTAPARTGIRTVFHVLAGVAFGFTLSRSGAADYNYIQGMFLLTEFQLYGIIGMAIVVTAPGLYLLKRRGRTATGDVLTVLPKARHAGNAIGGILFGIGWSITGMCPGPIVVNIGEGKLYALAAFAGALIGAGTFGTFYEALARRLALPKTSAKATGTFDVPQGGFDAGPLDAPRRS